MIHCLLERETQQHNKNPWKKVDRPNATEKSCFHIFIGLVVIQTQANFICGMKSQHFDSILTPLINGHLHKLQALVLLMRQECL